MEQSPLDEIEHTYAEMAHNLFGSVRAHNSGTWSWFDEDTDYLYSRLPQTDLRMLHVFQRDEGIVNANRYILNRDGIIRVFRFTLTENEVFEKDINAYVLRLLKADDEIFGIPPVTEEDIAVVNKALSIPLEQLRHG